MNPHPQPRFFLVLRRARWFCVSSRPANHFRLLFDLNQSTQRRSYLCDPALEPTRTDGNSFLTDHHYLLNHIQTP
jgi:hypothetical protein